MVSAIRNTGRVRSSAGWSPPVTSDARPSAAFISTDRPVEPAPSRWQFPPAGSADADGIVGLDTSVAILDALYDEFHDSQYATAPTLRRKVAAGQLGRKSGVGFYRY